MRGVCVYMCVLHIRYHMDVYLYMCVCVSEKAIVLRAVNVAHVAQFFIISTQGLWSNARLRAKYGAHTVHVKVQPQTQHVPAKYMYAVFSVDWGCSCAG